MITLSLRIRHQTDGAHDAVAWLLSGSDPTAWLTELIQCGVSLDSLRLYPLPMLMDDRQVAGVLVVPQLVTTPTGSYRDAKEATARPSWPMNPRLKPTTIAYGVIADRLFLPVDAVLHPPIDDSELRRLFSPEVVAYVFHPTIGLVGVEENNVLRVRDLLDPPKFATSSWDAARPGLKFNERLISIELADPPSLTSIFKEAREDIGSQSSSIAQLPSSPNEPGNGLLSELGRSLVSGGAKAMLWLTSLAPKNASKPTWIDSLESWASSKLAGVAQAVDSIRNKEICRLLDLLKNNPDEGLRYAFPLDGPAHRGAATPTNYLVRRPVDFDLSRLGGGLAAEYWQIERHYHERLRQSYRELAAREVHLGRHRRAAYIYAELLHDLRAAATTLKDGGHHREAAVLYRDRLNSPLEAAKCLEDGGLFGEAISLFEELKEYERAGDLHGRIDQPEEALDAYRMAADVHATSGDLLSAARILENKMELPNLALEALAAGWPESNQAGRCLQSLFELLARMGRHDIARDRVLALRDERYTAKQTQVAAATMAMTAASYPSEDVRSLAADSCRVVVGRSLSNAEASYQRQLLQAIEQLASEDRLLRRDCGRFGRRTVVPVIPRVSAPRLQRPAAPALIKEFTLPRGVQWLTVVAANESFYAAGYQGNTLSVVRGNWSGDTQSPTGQPWRVRPAAVTSIMLAPPINNVSGVWSHCDLIESSMPRPFSPTDQFPKSGVVTVTPGEPDRVLAIARGPSGVGWVLSFDRDGLCLVAYSPDDLLIRSVPLSSMELEKELCWSPVMMHASHEAIYIAGGVTLLRVGNNGDQSTDSFEVPIKSLAGTMPHTRTRLAIGFQQGGYVLWPGAANESDAQAFGQDLSDFETCFTKGGALVAISASGGEIYSTHDGKVELLATLKGSGEPPLAVVPTSYMKQFAVFMPSGAVQVYRLL